MQQSHKSTGEKYDAVATRRYQRHIIVHPRRDSTICSAHLCTLEVKNCNTSIHNQGTHLTCFPTSCLSPSPCHHFRRVVSITSIYQMCQICGKHCNAWEWETSGYAITNSSELNMDTLIWRKSEPIHSIHIPTFSLLALTCRLPSH